MADRHRPSPLPEPNRPGRGTFKPHVTPPKSSPAPRSLQSVAADTHRRPDTAQGKRTAAAPRGPAAGKPALPSTPRKWSFLDVYEHAPLGPWDVLFKGDAARAKKLDPKRWGPNLEQDPVKMKRMQGPTKNQSIGGWFVEWAYRHLIGDRSREIPAAQQFLDILREMTVKLFGGEQNSSTYYKYYIACGAAAVKWGDAWGQPEIAKWGRKMLCDYLALLLLHRTPVGIAMPGARVPRGVVGPDGKGTPEFEEVYTLLSTGAHPELAKKKLNGGYEVAQWSLRELGQKFEPSLLSEVGQQWPLYFNEYSEGWLSWIPSIKSYDPVIAVSYANGRLHELRWRAPGDKHKAEVTRGSVPLTAITENTFEASYPQVGWKASIPVPKSRRLRQKMIL